MGHEQPQICAAFMQNLIKRNYRYHQINNFCPNERQLQRFVDALSTAINTKNNSDNK